MRNMTWRQKKDWLEAAFGATVETIWNGPGDFTTGANEIELVQGRIRGSERIKGRTGEESISAYFDRIVNHQPDEHIVFGPENTRVTVNPDTLTLQPLVRR
ncbi:MAG: hypothetical protein WC043_06115 [Pseudobdellovibrionaceae bacterium]